MRRVIALLWISVAAVMPSRAEVPILPFDQIERGMQGEGRTVFHGITVESFDVEILGTLPNIGPRQNLILGRCSGGPLAKTGILAGMSGSPVYIDGKLIGAVAYSWAFAKDAIAGITPIEEMLRVAARADAPARPRSGSSLTPGELDLLERPEAIGAFLASRFGALAAQDLAGSPLQVPLSISGVGAAGLEAAAPGLRAAGFLPVQGAGAGRDPEPAPPLGPGTPVGLKLTRGDIDMTATGTVTWVDGDRVLAFGHPMFGLGDVDLPMTGARVEALLPTLQQSSRLATPLEELGALRQDRSAAVFGRLGATARMIPVRLRFTASSGEEHDFSFDIANDTLLAPLLLYSALNGVLANIERSFGNITVQVEEGSVIKLADREDVTLDNLFVGPTAPVYATGTSAFILNLLMNNDWAQPQIEGVNLILSYENLPRTARIRRITLDRYEVQAGDSVSATVVLSPYRGSEVVLMRELRVPADLPPGKLNVLVGGAMPLSRSMGSAPAVFPRDLDQLIRLINRLRRNDRVYLVATQEDTGVLVGGARLPNLPPSVSGILSRPQSAGNLALVRFREVLEEAISTEYSIEGLARVQLEVLAP